MSGSQSIIRAESRQLRWQDTRGRECSRSFDKLATLDESAHGRLPEIELSDEVELSDEIRDLEIELIIMIPQARIKPARFWSTKIGRALVELGQFGHRSQ
jgi:hypothetical protein